MRILFSHPRRSWFAAFMMLAIMAAPVPIAARPAAKELSAQAAWVWSTAFRRKFFRLKPVLQTLICAGDLKSQTAMNPDPKLAQAEAAANRLVDRFHQTLKFDELFNDEFVVDEKLREKSLSLDDEQKWKKFDLPTRERLYTAMMTWLHLWAEYQMIQKGHDVPPEFEKHPEPKIFSQSAPPQNLAELNQDISDLDRMSVVYRKYFPPGVFQSAQYRESTKSHSSNVPRVEKGNAKFGIPESVPIYIVRPEAFDYYFIEEKGAMKLFYVDILPDFRLF